MANITKRVNKRAAEHLGGASAQVAILCEMKGGLGVGAVGAVLARRFAEKKMRQRTDRALQEAGGTAADFPAATAAVAVTADRFIAMESNGIRFKAPTLNVSRADVRAESTGRKGMGKRVVFRFSDGSSAEVDVGPG